MQRIVVQSRVGDDGILHLEGPMSADDANRDVTVTVEPTARLSPEEWARRVMENAGTWQGNFERPDQGELQERDPL
ncbi:MAG TPA: hypothetical protein VGI99_05195 [Gemmataceae bacterium]